MTAPTCPGQRRPTPNALGALDGATRATDGADAPFAPVAAVDQDIPPDAARSRGVPAVERAVALLDALALAREPQSLAALARSLALPKSSLHGLLATLASAGLARRTADGQFALGPKPLQWAEAYASQSDVLRAFHDHADRTVALRTETIMLATLEGGDVHYLACRQGTRPLAVNFRVGGRFPAAVTSSGKAMLANLDEDEVLRRVGDLGAVRLTRHSVASARQLLQQLAAFREQGWATDDEETAEGMQCFGAAVFGARRAAPVAAVAVSVIKAGLAPARHAELVDAVRALAAAISAELGAGPRPPRPTIAA
jgi:IclR family transcriptional regulator, blcABC operon repressor